MDKDIADQFRGSEELDKISDKVNIIWANLTGKDFTKL
jgi:hypothetical protein